MLTDKGDDLGAEQFDGMQPGAGGYGATGGVDEVEASDVESPDRAGDLASDSLRRADVERAVLDLSLEVVTALRGPTALCAYLVHQLFVAGVVDLLGLCVGGCDEPGGVHTHRVRRRAELCSRALIELDVRSEPLRGAADYREHQTEPVAGGADDRLW